MTCRRNCSRIPGMASVDRYGGVNREIRVILDPAAIQAQGITTAQVNQQLRQINLDFGRRPRRDRRIRTIGARARQCQDRRRARRDPDRAARRPRGAARRHRPGLDGNSEQRSISKLNGRQILSFGITRAKGASDVTTYEAAEEELRKIEKDSDGKVKFNRIYTEVDATILQYESSMEMLWEGAILAVIVVFLFLRDWRATLIAAVAIPLSAIPTFWFLDLMGFTLNFLSLLALSLVAGVLVDDAIVEIENIVRHMRMGKTAYQASIDAADEIGLAVLATTMAIVAVFLPVGLMPGISGQFFKNFGFTVVVAVLISLFVARLITPLMAAYLLQEPRPRAAWRELRHAQVPRGAALDAASIAGRRSSAASSSLALTAFLFSQLAFDFLPAAEPRLQPGAHLPAAGVDPRAGRGGVDRSASRSSRPRPRSCRSSSASTSAAPTSTSRSSEDRERTSIEIERSLGAQAVGDRRRAGQFPVAVGRRSRRRRRRRARHHAPPRRRRSRSCCWRPPTRSPTEMETLARAARAARPGRPRPARNHHPAAAGPRRRPRRDDRGAGPDDPPRDAGRHRPEQRQILARRSPGADPRRDARRMRAATSRRSKICPCRPRPAARCR